MVYLDGAAHEGRSLHSLPKNPLQVPRGILELEALRHAPCEVLKALHRVAPRQSFIRSVQPAGTEKALSGLCLGGGLVVSLDLRGGGEGSEGCPTVPLPLPLIPGASVTANGQGRLGGQASRLARHSLGVCLLQQGTPELSALR